MVDSPIYLCLVCNEYGSYPCAEHQKSITKVNFQVELLNLLRGLYSKMNEGK